MSHDKFPNIFRMAEPCHLEDEVIGVKLRAMRELGEFRMCQIFQMEGEDEG